MTADVASLQIRVSSEQVAQASSRLDDLSNKGATAERATDRLSRATTGLGSALRALAGPLLGLLTVGTLARLFEDATTANNKLNASLRAVIPDAREAADAYGELKNIVDDKFSFQLEEVTTGFIDLINRGLIPSQQALVAYGNLAAGTGKQLGGLVDAVSNAVNGQFRQLRDFGVYAEAEGDRIVFRFRNVQTVVENSSEAIQKYLIGIGETQFGDAMQLQINTLGGALDKLKDAFGDIFEAISTQGFGRVATEQIQMATAALKSLEDAIVSGQAAAILQAFGGQFRYVAETAASAFNQINAFFTKSAQTWGDTVRSFIGYWRDAFYQLPINFVTGFKLISETLLGIVAIGVATSRGLQEAYTATFRLIARAALDLRDVLADVFDPTPRFKSLGEYVAAQKKAFQDFGTEVSNAGTLATATVEALGAQMSANIDTLNAERNAAIASFDAQIQKAGELRAAFEAAKDARNLNGNGVFEDPFAKFQTGDANFASEELRRRLEATQTTLATERELELAAFNERQRVLEDALNRRLLTQDAYQQSSTRNHELYAKRLTEIDRQENQTRLALQRVIYNSAASLATESFATIEQMAAKGSALQKAAFVAGKAIAVAQAIVSTELAALAALAPPPIGLGPIAGVGFGASIRAIGYASAALIAAQGVAEYKGKFEHGGMIPAGSYGMVGEAGPEIVQGPAVVTSARTTADKGQRDSAPVSVVVNNYTDAQAVVEERETADGKIIEVILRKVEETLSKGISSGGTKFSSALERAYALQRGRA